VFCEHRSKHARDNVAKLKLSLLLHVTLSSARFPMCHTGASNSMASNPILNPLLRFANKSTHGWSVRTSCTLTAIHPKIRTGCANESTSGSAGGINEDRPYRGDDLRPGTQVAGHHRHSCSVRNQGTLILSFRLPRRWHRSPLSVETNAGSTCRWSGSHPIHSSVSACDTRQR